MALTRRKKLRYMAEYVVARGVFSFLRLLPFKMKVRTGSRIIGFIVSHSRNLRSRIQNNLRYIFPDMPQAEIDRYVQVVGRNFGRTFTEILVNSDYYGQQQLFHASGPGLQALKAAQAEGKGVILVSGHLGQWEAMRQYLKAHGTEVGAIYRPNSNIYFDKMYLENLEKAGKPVFPTGQRGMVQMVRHLRNGGVVGLLTDQYAANGEPLQFMGKETLTSDSAAQIALKLGIPLIPCYGIRRENGFDIDIHFLKPVSHTDALTMTQELNDSLEEQVRAHPGQWYWLHRRWGKLG